MDFQILLLAAVLSLCGAELMRLDEVEVGLPQPYTFGYEVHDNHGDQWRTEASDGFGHVHGSYGFVDSEGMRREVQYVADDGGFRAHIRTNEPGMDMPNPADVIMVADPPSDYDAAVYGLENLHPSHQARYPPRHTRHPRQQVRRPPQQERSNRPENPRELYKYQKFAEPSSPPVYVRDGHLQSPWFPMDTVAKV